MCGISRQRTLERGRRTRSAGSLCCRRMTNRFCGTSGARRGITSRIVHGLVSVRVPEFRCCAERCRRKWVARKIKVELEKRGLHKEPLGVDVVEPPILFALEKEGIKVVDGQQVMSDARVIKTQDEISLLNHSAAMVDAAYDELYRAMKPGMSENQAVGLVSKVLYDLGSEFVEAVNAISGERCSPHPHVFSDRMLRPGDPVYYDILHSYMGYRTCYYRCFTIGYASHAMRDAYKRCREYLDAAIELVRPGRTTAEIASVWPKAEEFGFPDEEAAFALQFDRRIQILPAPFVRI